MPPHATSHHVRLCAQSKYVIVRKSIEKALWCVLHCKTIEVKFKHLLHKVNRQSIPFYKVILKSYAECIFYLMTLLVTLYIIGQTPVQKPS